MKKTLILLSITLLFSCGSLTGTITPKEDYKKEHIISNLSLSKNDLYVKANSWMVDTFKSAESVIEFTDKESGTIIGKYLLQGEYAEDILVSVDTRVFAKIDIRVKDNSAKILILPTNDIKIFNKTAQAKINLKITDLILSFQNSISTENKDW